MINGDNVFLEGECFDPKTYKRLRGRLNEANPDLLGYLNMIVMESGMPTEMQRRFLWLGHITLEILGASSRDDEDFVAVDEEYIYAAEHTQTAYDAAALSHVHPSFAAAVAEAKEYGQLVNEYLDSCEGNQIDWEIMWQKIDSKLVKAYAFATSRKR